MKEGRISRVHIPKLIEGEREQEAVMNITRSNELTVYVLRQGRKKRE